mmetsp:Transcript_40373/g.133630  ORF Transcript_40373/g.133630 Transcript_40373/m.133630 type:complete len:202 (+) Transcript_40373:176-781(+)
MSTSQPPPGSRYTRVRGTNARHRRDGSDPACRSWERRAPSPTRLPSPDARSCRRKERATLAPARAGLAEVWDLEALRQSAVHCSRREALESRRCLVRKVADERGCDGLEGRGDPTNHVVEQAVERAEAEAHAHSRDSRAGEVELEAADTDLHTRLPVCAGRNVGSRADSHISVDSGAGASRRVNADPAGVRRRAGGAGGTQ